MHINIRKFKRARPLTSLQNSVQRQEKSVGNGAREGGKKGPEGRMGSKAAKFTLSGSFPSAFL